MSYKLDSMRPDQRPFSEYLASKIDKEVNELKMACYNDALKIVSAHKEEIKILAELLLEKNVLDASEITKVLKDTKEAREKASH